MRVDGAPQQVGFTAQAYKHLVEVPRATGLAACRFDPMSKARAKLVAPAADRLVADYHPTLKQQLFDVAQAELKSEVPTHRMADDRRRESVAVIE
ncbi:hypothetical protein AB870_25225 (plasmid) [Pandoraea faecigallinarum]|uniref:Uncharacterized protein n=1 Tax=Pandoraea faecigallinarum TaxID=656179 RepID=A0A0H3WZE2_9BURK|nr:hypothetical protein AB870_25225 [Pandoraea faecigallinarum]